MCANTPLRSGNLTERVAVYDTTVTISRTHTGPIISLIRPSLIRLDLQTENDWSALLDDYYLIQIWNESSDKVSLGYGQKIIIN